jgi:hypothetical protein
MYAWAGLSWEYDPDCMSVVDNDGWVCYIVDENGWLYEDSILNDVEF